MQDVEFSILYWFQTLHNPVLDRIAVAITSLGTAGIFWIVLTIVLLIVCKDKRVGWTSALSLAICAIIINLILKNAVQRPRPCWIDPGVKMLVKIPKDFSFPSGHSGASFASSCAIVQYKKKLGVFLIILGSFIALSRLYLFVHWPTDVLTGIGIGICSAILAGYLIRYADRRRNH